MQYSSHCSLRIDSWTVFCNRHNCYYSASSASLLLLVFQAGAEWVMVGGCRLLSAVSAGSGTVQPSRVQWHHHPGPPTNCWTNQSRTGRGGPRSGELGLTGCPSNTLTVSQTGHNHLVQVTTWLERIVKEQKLKSSS